MKRALISYTLPWSKYIWLWYFQFTILDWQKYNLIIKTILLDPTPLANRVVSPSFKKKTCSYYISYAILNSISHLSPLWPPTRKWPSKPKWNRLAKSEGVSYVHTQFNSMPSVKTIYSHQRWVIIVVSSDFTTFLLVNTSPSSQSECWGYYLLFIKSTKNNTSLTNAEYLLLHHATFLLVNMSPSSPSHWWR